MRRRLDPIPTLAAMALAALALAAPVGAADPFPDTIALPDGWRPEGITLGRGTTVYVGSLADGGIWKGDLRTGVGDEAFVEDADGPAVGIEYEARADRLWVVGGPSGQVRVYDATTGELLAQYQFSLPAFLNDVVVTRDAAYVTDSLNQRLIVIPLGSGGALPEAGLVVPLTGDVVYDPVELDLNGITEWHGELIAVQTWNGALFRIDPATGETTEIAPAGTAVRGDGIEVRGNTLYVVQNFLNTVAAFRLGDDLESVEAIGTVSAQDGFELDIPTTAVVRGDSLWVVNARFSTAPGPDVEYWITRLPARF